MIHIEQYGSNTFYIRNLPPERPVERYELVEMLRDAVNQGIDPREFLDSDVISRFIEESGEALF